MRNLLAFIGLLVVGFGVAGWYLGWYKLNVSRSIDGNLQIQADVDTKKVTSDATEGFKNLSTAVEKQADKAAKDTNTSPPTGTPGTTPGPVNSSQGSAFNPLSPSLPESPKLPTVPPRGTTIQLIPPK